MRRTGAALSPIVSALSLLFYGTVHAQEYLYWPMPGQNDIRGTYGDYREYADGSPTFHEGIDIHAPGGTHASGVVDRLVVQQILFDDNKGYQVEVMDYDTLEPYLYAHIQGQYSNGNPITLNDVIVHGERSFLIFDFDQDGVTDNDHLHLGVGWPSYRNPCG